MNKTMKIVGVLLAVMLVFAMSTSVFAKIDLDAGYSSAETMITTNKGDSTAANSVAKMANSVIGVVQVVGMAVAVIMLIVLAIKYISAAPSDKAEIKKHAVVYVVGAVVLFAATGILEIVKNFSKNIG